MFPRDRPRPISKKRGPSTPKFHVLKRSLVNRCMFNLRRRSPTLLTAKPMPKHRLGRSVFTQKQVFCPRTAKSQPIWIKFCTHLLLYGIYSWADLDRDRRAGGSRPNQNDYVFVIRVTNPKSYTETTDRRDFGGKPLKWRRGRVLS